VPVPEVRVMIGGFHVPSSTDRSGQWARSQIEKLPLGAGNQLASLSSPGDSLPDRFVTG
jgi:hypothetical protein